MAATIPVTGTDTEANDPPPISELERRAEDGDLKAALSLGMRYRDGKGVESDNSKAMHWYRFCADRGDAYGMDNVGFMYMRGKGVPQNEEVAVGFFKAASSKGNSQATYNLGECYFSGQGVEQDYARAITTWEKAAKVGHRNAKWRLAMIYASGESVPVDLEKAERLCGELAKGGHSNSMLLLGEICDRRGDTKEALGWWKKAAEKDNPQAKALLELSEWKDEPPVPGERAYIDVGHFYQGWNNCGSTSISMFLRQADGKLTPYDVKRLCPQSPIGTGTDWEHLLAVAPKVDQDWKLITFTNDDKGFSKGIAEIKRLLDLGQPVVIDFTYTRVENGEVKINGHTLLVVGYNTKADYFVLKNPNQPSPGVQFIFTEELKESWYSKGYTASAKGKAARPLIVHTTD